eukprot:gene21501-biopygen22181
MGPQPHTYGRGRFFRGRARGPFFAAGRYNGPGGPRLQVPGRPPHPPNAPALQFTGPPYRSPPDPLKGGWPGGQAITAWGPLFQTPWRSPTPPTGPPYR